MTKRSAFTFLTSSLVCTLCFACTETAAVNNNNPFVPAIDNTWMNVLDDTHRFSLTSDTGSKGEPHGTFHGFELTSPGDSFPLTGNFVNENVDFTVTRSSAVQFSGVFIHADTMQLNSPTDGALTIWR